LDLLLEPLPIYIRNPKMSRVSSLLLIVLCACVQFIERGVAQPRSEVMPDLPTIWPLRSPSVVRLTVSGKDPLGNPVQATSGLGVFVSSQGHILTAMHVVRPDSAWGNGLDGLASRRIDVEAFTSEGLRSLGSAQAIMAMSANDAAIISLSLQSLPAPVAAARPPEGAWVIAVPWYQGANLPQPVVVQTTTTDQKRVGELMTLAAALQPGHS
jgi:hypothetical protein